MKSIVWVLGALVLVVGYGVAEGLWTDRWGLSGELEQASARVSRVPRTFGDWEGRDFELDPDQIRQAQIISYVQRRYVHRQKGTEITVLLVCGRPGPTALHSPNICYEGAGYTPAFEQERKAFTIAGLAAPAAFHMVQYQKSGPAPEPLLIYWSWNATGDWQVPDNPPFHFGHHRALYKLYVIRQLTKVDESLQDDPSPEFIGQFLPEVHKALFQKD